MSGGPIGWSSGRPATSARAPCEPVIEHPNLELVGVYVFSEAKAGKDAGELCGLQPTGVIATRDVDEILALRARLRPLHGRPAGLRRHLPAARVGYQRRVDQERVPSSRQPRSRGPGPDRVGVRERAARRLHSTGSSPGFITEALPIVLLSLQRSLDQLTIEEFADMSSRNSPEMIFDLMGFGRDPAAFDPRGVEAHGGSSFRRFARGGGRCAVAPTRRGGGEGSGGRRQLVVRHRGRARSRRERSRRSDMEVTGMHDRPAVAHASAPTGISRPTSSRPGIFGTPVGTSWSRATRRSTSTSASRFRPTSGRPRRRV